MSKVLDWTPPSEDLIRGWAAAIEEAGYSSEGIGIVRKVCESARDRLLGIVPTLSTNMTFEQALAVLRSTVSHASAVYRERKAAVIDSGFVALAVDAAEKEEPEPEGDFVVIHPEDPAATQPSPGGKIVDGSSFVGSESGKAEPAASSNEGAKQEKPKGQTLQPKPSEDDGGLDDFTREWGRSKR